MIKKFIDDKENDILSLYRGLDLQELLFQVEAYYLEYRDSLNLKEDVTFGVEIEYEGIRRSIMASYIERKLSNWNSKTDGSLNSGGEITSPIMVDKLEYWKELKLICDYLSRNRANMSSRAGGHIHIGANILGDDIEVWKIFLKLYMCYEHVLFRFLYGDKVNGRRFLLKYASPFADCLYDSLSDINLSNSLKDIGRIVGRFNRYVALNLHNVRYGAVVDDVYKNTIEFRNPNATSEATIIQNNINALTKLCTTASNKMIDEEFLDYKISHDFYCYKGNEYLYTTVNLKNALEFVDLIFDNNLDKVYFLRQYLKSFQEMYENIPSQKAKRFVR